MNSSAKPPGRACWPVIWLWILAISQYAYRYILQVNDPRTTNYYAATPAALSAIKYEILLLFAIYAGFRFFRRPVGLSSRFTALAQSTFAGVLALIVILLGRIIISPGDITETYLCATQFMPWMASVVLIPFLTDRDQSVLITLATFERIAFWLTFSFWLMTVILVLTGVRYPALSYPGVIVRFGGILDDPNGYACLCLLLMALAVGSRRGRWMTRTVIYGGMLVATLSISGYATAAVICLCLIAFRIYRTRQSAVRWLLIATSACAVAFVVLTILPTIYNLNAAVQTLGELYLTKGNSAAAHIADLLPAQSTLHEPSLFGMLFGSGGFSENFYWRILSNFGVGGLAIVISIAALWLYFAAGIQCRWRRTLTAWHIGVLVGSNGIAYLLTFPLGLIYWSSLAFLLCGGARNATSPHEYAPPSQCQGDDSDYDRHVRHGGGSGSYGAEWQH